MQTVSKFI